MTRWLQWGWLCVEWNQRTNLVGDAQTPRLYATRLSQLPNPTSSADYSGYVLVRAWFHTSGASKATEGRAGSNSQPYPAVAMQTCPFCPSSCVDRLSSCGRQQRHLQQHLQQRLACPRLPAPQCRQLPPPHPPRLLWTPTHLGGPGARKRGLSLFVSTRCMV